MKITDIKGMWQCCLDAEKVGVEEKFYLRHYDDIIELPGTTSQAHLGPENEDRETGFLTDPYKFTGYAWFTRVIAQDPKDIGRVLKLFLERTRITRVWVDDTEIEGQDADSLCAPHIYDLTEAVEDKPEFKLTIMVSNTDYPTGGGHMTSPDTQTNWNGICGRMELWSLEDDELTAIRVDADQKTGRVSVRMDWFNRNDTSGYLDLRFKLMELSLLDDKLAAKIIDGDFHGSATLPTGKSTSTADFVMDNFVSWSEYSPVVYMLEVYGRDETYYGRTFFGFRDITADEHHFYVNGVKTFLRGKHDGMIFPMTGAAPCDLKSWIDVLKTSKSYGINHYRFHTCCPPGAAFLAADLVGIYMSPELPFWGTIAAPGEEGFREEEQNYLIEEGFRMLKYFGSHASYTFMSLGNELWGSSDRLNEILAGYKKVDSRHLYTQGSNNFQFVPCIVDNDDYFVGVRFGNGKLIRGSYAMCDAPQGFVQTDKPNTDHDYDAVFNEFTGDNAGTDEEIEIQYGTGTKKVKATDGGALTLNKPVVSHEIGQYDMFPDFNEIKKYTGLLKPRNLEVFKERVDAAGFLGMADEFFKASGKLAVQAYKEELEAAHRSKLLAGYQILDLQDFTGQGTALVGILNSFMESKGLISASDWKNFSSDVVLMAKFHDYVLTGGQNFDADIILSDYRPDHIGKKLQINWGFYDKGRVSIDYGDVDEILLASGRTELEISELGVLSAGSISVKIPECIMPERAALKLEIFGENIANSYELYIFPDKDNFDIYPADRNRISVVQNVEDAIRSLRAGKNTVLFIETNKESVPGTYCTDFWNYPMFKGISDWMKRPRPIGTLGMYINTESEALFLFPSEEYTTPQWYNIITDAKLTILDDAPQELVPIVSVIDNVERNHRLGLIWEAMVDDFPLLVVAKSSAALMATNEGKQLIKSLLCYAATDDFLPKAELTEEELKKLL